MGISWGLETRVLELFVIECLSCSLLPPQKNHKKSFQKSESQEILCLRLMRSFGVFFVQALHQVREDYVVS